MKQLSTLNSQLSTLRGLTLIELIVVMAIIGILAGITALSTTSSLAKSRDAKRKSELRQIQTAIELYRSDKANGQVPLVLPPCGDSLNGEDGRAYLQKTPCDPKTGSSYLYKTNNGTNPTRYCLRACLERTNDPEKDSADPEPFQCSTPTNCTAVNAGTVNFTLTSP